MSGTTKVKMSWKTIKIIEVGGKAFAVQQRHTLYAHTYKGKGGYGMMEAFPEDRHRMVPLLDLIENEEDVIGELEDEGF